MVPTSQVNGFDARVWRPAPAIATTGLREAPCKLLTYPTCKHITNKSSFIEATTSTVASRAKRKCVLLDYTHRPMPYDEGWQLQRECVNHVLSFINQGFNGHDYLIILQHSPVFTLGAGSSERHLRFPVKDPPFPVRRVERGGEVTYHGPGQLVMYPVLDLRYYRRDLHWYMRSLEQLAISSLWEVSGLEACRVEGMTGVWLGQNKVAAIGVRARKWVTFHGLAVNVQMNLSPFDLIVPCGITGRGVTSVSEELNRLYGVQGGRLQHNLLAEYVCALKEAFVDVFGVELVAGSPPLAHQLMHELTHHVSKIS